MSGQSAATRCLIFHRQPLPVELLPLLRDGGVRETEIIRADRDAPCTQTQAVDIIAVVDESDEHLDELAGRFREHPRWRLLPWLVFGTEESYPRRVAILRKGYWEYLRFDEEERTRKKIGLTIDFYRDCTISTHMEGWVSFKLKSEYNYVREVNFFISRLQFMTTLTAEEIEDLEYAFLEIGNNAVEHGNLDNSSKTIQISYCIFEDKLIIKIEDEGRGFKPVDVQAPVDEESILRGRGRGLYMVRQMVDEVEFNERGNVCLMTKRFEPLTRT